ncbi:hypothetical protein TYRP_016284 [Tyrophagus putrescentiae]|nr:hypothetical protein TYRP_016284 [Tyrophagus putrescentiae]
MVALLLRPTRQTEDFLGAAVQHDGQPGDHHCQAKDEDVLHQQNKGQQGAGRGRKALATEDEHHREHRIERQVDGHEAADGRAVHSVHVLKKAQGGGQRGVVLDLLLQLLHVDEGQHRSCDPKSAHQNERVYGKVEIELHGEGTRNEPEHFKGRLKGRAAETVVVQRY